MRRIAWASLSAALAWSLAGCASGDSTMDDINGDPGPKDSVEAGSEASAPPPYTDDAGAATGSAEGSAGPRDSSTASVDSGGIEDSGPADAPSYDVADPEIDAWGPDAGPPDSGVAEAGFPPDSASSGDICPSGAQYPVEAAAAAISGKATLCPTGSWPTGQCCYEQLSPANVCVAR